MTVLILIILFSLSKAKNHQILMKRFERSVSWNEYKTKKEIYIRQASIDIFLNKTLFWFGFLVYLNRGGDVKKYSAKKYYLPTGVIEKYSVIINRKNFYDQAIDSNIKRYE